MSKCPFDEFLNGPRPLHREDSHGGNMREVIRPAKGIEKGGAPRRSKMKQTPGGFPPWQERVLLE
jgi:hypothetical protein